MASTVFLSKQNKLGFYTLVLILLNEGSRRMSTVKKEKLWKTEQKKSRTGKKK
jgi:hypothetical protein